jgi:hypothetical protein
MVMRGWFNKQGSRLILSVVTSVVLVWPTTSFSVEVIDQKPTNFEMLGDAIFVRPLLAVATLFGAAVFVITLPFSAMGGNTKEAATVLVAEPGDALLFRCLGCTEQEDAARDKERADNDSAQAAVDAAAEAAEQDSKAAASK